MPDYYRSHIAFIFGGILLNMLTKILCLVALIVPNSVMSKQNAGNGELVLGGTGVSQEVRVYSSVDDDLEDGAAIYALGIGPVF